MKRLINALRRALIGFDIHSLEIHLVDQTMLMRGALTQEDFLTVYMAREKTKKELAAARASYNSLLPVGERKTWGVA